MAFALEFYRKRSGEEPALEYIRAQIKRHRAKIGRALKYLEDAGQSARRPQVDYLGDDIYELRVPVDQHQHRLLYFFYGRTVIVVTSGFSKTKRKVPLAEMDRARARRADWMTRFGGKT